MRAMSLLDRRAFLAASAAALVLPAPRLRAPEQPKPRNILFVMTDDQRWDSLGCMGHPFLKTPHIDRLAREGALCENMFVTTSLCSPSRATVLSGQYAHRHGVLDNGTLLPPDTPIWPELLRKAGYETAYIGKWHMGGITDEPRPGFDHWVSFKGQGPYFNPTFNVNGVREKTEGYTTDLITDRAVAWIEGRGAKPWAMVVGHKATHSDFRPAPRHAAIFSDVKIPDPMADDDANYRNVPHWVRAQRKTWHGVDGMYDGKMTWEDFYRNYHRCLVAVDESMGRLLEALEKKGVLDTTLILFTSDNGFLHGEHGLIDKRCMYEESIRIPMLARCPEIITAGRRVAPMILNIDDAPTLLDAAGIPAPPTMQGRSFLPLLRGEEIPWRSSFLYEYFFERDFAETPTVLGVRTQTHKLMTFHGIRDVDELYDLSQDPRERRNLIADPAAKEVKDSLKAELLRLLDEMGGRFNPRWAH